MTFVCVLKGILARGLLGLNNIYFETIEKRYKYYTNLVCHGLCLLAVWPGKVGRGSQRGKGRVH